ncbi:MAG: SDR family NAD(P)-dependent oxidoreductase [Alphaproteobacteria bacterium]
MDLQLKGKTCLVSGASIGIGHGIARALAAEGARVAITARRVNLLEELAETIVAEGGERPVIIPGDIATDEGPGNVAAAALKAFGHVDVMVNNVGGSRPMAWDAPEELWEEGYRLNFLAARRMTTPLIHGMIENRFGRIISITGSTEARGVNAATSSKAAITAWSKGLSKDLGKYGITSNCIPPGRINSEQILNKLHPDPVAREAYAKANVPAGYFGEPEDLAVLVAFLASPRARYINGEVIHVDGGMRMFTF